MSGMAIRRHGDGKWMIDVRHGQNERYRVVYEGTREGAMILHQEMKRKLGILVIGTISVDGLVEDYLSWCEVHQSPNTAKHKRKLFYANILLTFGPLHPDMITTQIIDKYQQKRKAEIQSKAAKGGSRQINLEINYLAVLFRGAGERSLREPYPKYKAMKYKRPVPTSCHTKK